MNEKICTAFIFLHEIILFLEDTELSTLILGKFFFFQSSNDVTFAVF